MTIYYCSEVGKWSCLQCPPRCDGTHIDRKVLPGVISMLLNAISSAFLGIQDGSTSPMGVLNEAYEIATGGLQADQSDHEEHNTL